jgi:hypothetical protein
VIEEHPTLTRHDVAAKLGRAAGPAAAEQGLEALGEVLLYQDMVPLVAHGADQIAAHDLDVMVGVGHVGDPVPA